MSLPTTLRGRRPTTQEPLRFTHHAGSKKSRTFAAVKGIKRDRALQPAIHPLRDPEVCLSQFSAPPSSGDEPERLWRVASWEDGCAQRVRRALAVRRVTGCVDSLALEAGVAVGPRGDPAAVEALRQPRVG